MNLFLTRLLTMCKPYFKVKLIKSLYMTIAITSPSTPVFLMIYLIFFGCLQSIYGLILDEKLILIKLDGL